MNRLLKIKTCKMTFHQISHHFVSRLFRESRLGCPRIARVTSSEELGTMSRNNLSGATLGIRPISEIYSLTLIFSCWCPFIHPDRVRYFIRTICLDLCLGSIRSILESNVSNLRPLGLLCTMLKRSTYFILSIILTRPMVVLKNEIDITIILKGTQVRLRF